VIVAPGGAVNAWPEWLKPTYVPWVSLLLTPAVGLPFVGQASYAVPAFANRTQAVVLWPKAAAESHDTTVYWPATAVGQLMTTIAATAVPTRPLTRCLWVISLIYCAEATHARDKPSDPIEIFAICTENADYKLSLLQ